MDYKHPLASLVIQAFAKDECQDEITIALHLGAPTKPVSALKAYKVVAIDVLGVLAEQGLVVRRSDGWYRSVAGEQLSG